MEEKETAQNYEMMVILKGEIPEEEIGFFRKKLEDWVQEKRGTIHNVEVWGKRGLAYAIGSHTEGYYLLLYFELPPSQVKSLEKALRLEENLIRFKIFKKERRAVHAGE